MPINVILVDDHKMFLDGLESVIKDHSDISVIATARNGRQALNIINARAEEIDVIVLDINMPEINGIRVTEKVKDEWPDLKVLALTMHDDKTHILKLKEVGIDGYILKDDGHEILIKAISTLYHGETFFGDAVTRTLLDSIGKKKVLNSSLTDREVQVLSLIGRGLKGPEIAAELNISENTVQTHRRNIRVKLNLRNSLELVGYALKNGIGD